MFASRALMLALPYRVDFAQFCCSLLLHDGNLKKAAEVYDLLHTHRLHPTRAGIAALINEMRKSRDPKSKAFSERSVRVEWEIDLTIDAITARLFTEGITLGYFKCQATGAVNVLTLNGCSIAEMVCMTAHHRILL